MAQIAVRTLRGVAVIYLTVLLLLLYLENLLLYPAPRYPAGDWDAAWLKHEDIYFQSQDGTRLHGWWVEHPEPKLVILYSHGNGTQVADLPELMELLRDEYQASVFAYDYRGYGRSDGKPFEVGILQDGEAAQAWLSKRAAVPPEEIVLMGRSLGGGVAVDLAAKKGARGLILQNTFSSLPDAAAHLYPWAPVRWLMRNRYDSISKIKNYQGPVFQSHGTRDTLVPFQLSRKLFEQVSGQKEFFEVPGGNHNSAEPPEYYQALGKFLSSLPAHGSRSQ